MTSPYLHQDLRSERQAFADSLKSLSSEELEERMHFAGMRMCQIEAGAMGDSAGPTWREYRRLRDELRAMGSEADARVAASYKPLVDALAAE